MQQTLIPGSERLTEAYIFRSPLNAWISGENSVQQIINNLLQNATNVVIIRNRYTGVLRSRNFFFFSFLRIIDRFDSYTSKTLLCLATFNFICPLQASAAQFVDLTARKRKVLTQEELEERRRKVTSINQTIVFGITCPSISLGMSFGFQNFNTNSFLVQREENAVKRAKLKEEEELRKERERQRRL